MQMNQKISAAFILLCAPYLLLTACDTKEQKALNAQREAQAVLNAQEYIRQKYGFAAEVTQAKVDRRHGWISTQPLSDVLVQMQHDDRSFTVFITGEEQSTAGADNYQAEEIAQAIRETVDAEIPGLHLFDVFAVQKAASLSETDAPLYEVRYDGSNLPEVLTGAVRLINCYYPDTDFSQEKDFSTLETLFGKESGISMTFYACRDDSVFELETPQSREWNASHAIYCTQQRSLSYIRNDKTFEGAYTSYDLRKCGAFSYTLEYDEKQTERDEPQLQETEPVDAALFRGYGVSGGAVASAAYRVTGDVPGKVHIYYPCSAIANFDYDSFLHSETVLAQCTVTGGETKYAAHPVTVVGDYVYAEIDIRSDVETTFEFLYKTA